MSQKCPSLAVMDRQYVPFNPHNYEHRKAFKMLCLGVDNDNFRQHPTLRFSVEQPFTDVRTMMFHKIGEAFIEDSETIASAT
jgi:hypothetical protein